MKLGMYEQQMKQIHEHLQFIEQNILELTELSIGLNEIKGKDGNEILAKIGEGIFVEAKISSEELLVEVGGRKFVKKNVEETKKIIEQQIEKLGSLKENLSGSLEQMSKEVNEFLINLQNENKNN